VAKNKGLSKKSIPNNTPSKKNIPNTAVVNEVKGNIFFNKRTFTVAAICVLTFICFRYSLHNEFTNWDDDVYITNDPYIRSFTIHNLIAMFTRDITKNMYHPLCMLSLAINYHFAQLSPMTYYLTNILIHITNTVLVFLFLSQLSKMLKIDSNGIFFISAFGALWFGVHPVHVEAISWITERKDVLYAFFYLLALLSYLKYISTRDQNWHWAAFSGNSWYWVTFFLFIASCLSKPMAVVFPVALLCIDFMVQKEWNRKIFTRILIEKIPLFVAALACGITAIITQKNAGAIASFGVLTLSERIMYASYGFVMYIVKFFNPTFLSTFYPYPLRYIDGTLPWIYYAAPFIAIAIVVAPLYFTYKRYPGYFRVFVFGYGFFVANLIFVLQFISCGTAIMADRYSYVSYISLFFMTAYFLWEIIKHLPSLKIAIVILLVALSGELSYICYQRTLVWHNAETLLQDAIDKYPYRAWLSYKWLGNYYLDKGDVDKALENYSVLAQVNQADAKIYDNIGNIYRQKKDYKNAITAFSKSLQKQDNVYKTYLDLSVTYTMIGDSANAYKNYSIANQLNPNTEKVLSDMGFSMVQNKEFSSAINEYNILIKLNPNDGFYYFYRGVAEYSEGKTNEAISDWLSALKFKSQDLQPSAAYNLGVAYESLGNYSNALAYVNISKGMGYKVDTGYLNKLKKLAGQQ